MPKNPAVQISPAEHKVLQLADGLLVEVQPLLINWSHINSGSHNASGLAQMRGEIEKWISDHLSGALSRPVLTAAKHVDAKGVIQETEFEPAILYEIRPDAPIQIVMTGHYDTVFPKNSDFQTTTFLDDDTLGGPGVADMKGGILVLLHALKIFETYEVADNVGCRILLSPDEETGSLGSAPLLAELAKKSHIGMTYEPSLADGSMAGARKGSGNFAIIIKGRAAHAGREHHLGKNAIAAMARIGVVLDDLNGQRDGVTINLAKIDGGGASNIVPDTAIGRFNVRMSHEDDQQWILDHVHSLIEGVNDQDGLSAKLTGGFTRPPKPMAPANGVVFNWVKQAGNALGLDIRWSDSGGVCEGNNLWASGCPNVDTLGVIGGEIHSDREFMRLSSIEDRIRLSALILMKIAKGEFDAHHAKQLARPSAKKLL